MSPIVDCAADALISIHPRHVSNMLSGKKKVEIRRRSFWLPENTRLWIYATKPLATILCTATVRGVVTKPPGTIWNRFRDDICVSLAEYKQYSYSCSRICAIILEDIREICSTIDLGKLRAIDSSFHPPQQYKRLMKSDPVLLALEHLSR
ncbi:MAG: ASCH domain-containing protein [Elusimicrobia bacterium]|nr:ASCH domain-containing protein [Elusimicrobiota bacterium]